MVSCEAPYRHLSHFGTTSLCGMISAQGPLDYGCISRDSPSAVASTSVEYALRHGTPTSRPMHEYEGHQRGGESSSPSGSFQEGEDDSDETASSSSSVESETSYYSTYSAELADLWSAVPDKSGKSASNALVKAASAGEAAQWAVAAAKAADLKAELKAHWEVPRATPTAKQMLAEDQDLKAVVAAAAAVIRAQWAPTPHPALRNAKPSDFGVHPCSEPKPPPKDKRLVAAAAAAAAGARAHWKEEEAVPFARGMPEDDKDLVAVITAAAGTIRNQWEPAEHPALRRVTGNR